MATESTIAPAAPATPAPAATFTLEQVQGLIQEAVNPMAAEIRRLRDAVPKPPQEVTKEATLTQRIKAFEDRQLVQDARARATAIKAAAIEAKVDPTRVPLLLSHMNDQHKDKIVYNPETDTLAAKDAYGEPTVKFSDYLKTFLGSAEGEVFRLPAHVQGDVRGVRPSGQQPSGGVKQYHELTPGQRDKLSRDEIATMAKAALALDQQ